jgi:hypothetical protein
VPAAGASAPTRWTARLGHQRHREAVWGWVKSLGCYGKVGLQRTAGEGGPSAERIGGRQQRAEERSAAALIAGGSFSSPRNKDPAFTPQYGGHPRLACAGTGDGPLGTRLRYGARSHATGSRSQAIGVKGSRLLVPRGCGAWTAQTPRRRDAQRAAQGRQADRTTTFAKVVLCFSRRIEQERQAKFGFCRTLMNSENCS